MDVEDIVIAHGGDISVPSGGTNRVTVFAESLSQRFNVHLVVPKCKSSLPDRLTNISIHEVNISKKMVYDQPIRALLVGRKALALSDELNAVLQIEHSTLGGVLYHLGSRGYVLDMHDLEFDGSLYKGLPLTRVIPPVIKHMEKRSVAGAQHIIVVSDVMKEFLVREWDVDPSKISIIHNGHFEDGLTPVNTRASTDLDIVSFLGSLTDNIDYGKFLKVADKLNGVLIIIIGDGKNREKLETMVEDSNIDNIVTTGYLPDQAASNLLMLSDVCIFPLEDTLHSKVAMHMKGLEYASLGRAIVTDRDATGRLLAQENAALVSEPSDTDSFVDNVKMVLNDSALQESLENNAQKFSTRMSWASQGADLVELYDSELVK